MTTRVVFLLLAALVLLTRLAHLDLLWVEEAYSSAAAAEVLSGKVLYRDIWFDKPPLYALVYVLWGAVPGLPLRIAGTVYVLLSCCALWRMARSAWGVPEANLAAVFLGFFLTFNIPSAAIALAPDLLMIPAQIAAIHYAWRGHPFSAGLWSSVCLLFNAKGIFVAAACAVFVFRQLPTFAAGLVLPQLLAMGILAWAGALSSYRHQVWWWGAKYSADTFINDPLGEGLRRTLGWLGFHSALVVGSVVYIWRERSGKFAVWTGSGFAGIIAGLRFFPRYYFQVLPAACFGAARGYNLAPRTLKIGMILLLLIPAVRFGPRFLYLLRDQARGVEHEWSDTALMRDSAEVGRRLKESAKSGDNLLVWGYRPDIYVYSGLSAATRFLDSQPLTGVIADRHLTSSKPTFPELAERNRSELLDYSPAFIVDGLGPLNPELAIDKFADLESWLARYEIVSRTRTSVIYALKRAE